MRKRARDVYRRGDCVLGWRGKIAVADYRDASGKRRRKRLGRLTETEARSALDTFAEARRIVQQQQASYTVGDLWGKWLEERSEDGFSNDIYEANWVALAPTFANRYPATLAAKDFRDYTRERFNLGRKASTVHTELVRLRSCLKWAHETRLVEILVKVWVPSPGKGRKRVLSIPEAQRLVRGAALGDPHIYLFVVLLFATGARHTAILDLTWDRVDFVAGTIQYDEELPRDPMSKAYRKGRATVPMNRAAREALERAYIERQTDYVIEHGGKRIKTECREGFRNAVKRAGLDAWHKDGPVTPHVIRHTVATWLDAQKIETKRAAQLLGHQDEDTTKLYTHASHSLLTEAVAALDVAFAPLPIIAKTEDGEDASEGVDQVANVPNGQSLKNELDTDKSPNPLYTNVGAVEKTRTSTGCPATTSRDRPIVRPSK